MINQIKAFLKGEEGSETLEYVVIVAAIVGLAVTAYGAGLPGVLRSAFSTMAQAIG